MPKLRKGDTVTFKAVVTAVADYDGGQQIMAKLLPKGEELGWCVPKEYDFAPAELRINVGDMVNIEGRPCHVGGFEVVTMFDNGQVALKKPGEWPVFLDYLKDLRRR